MIVVPDTRYKRATYHDQEIADNISASSPPARKPIGAIDHPTPAGPPHPQKAARNNPAPAKRPPFTTATPRPRPGAADKKPARSLDTERLARCGAEQACGGMLARTLAIRGRMGEYPRAPPWPDPCAG
jgi:hypothetical protein